MNWGLAFITAILTLVVTFLTRDSSVISSGIWNGGSVDGAEGDYDSDRKRKRDMGMKRGWAGEFVSNGGARR